VFSGTAVGSKPPGCAQGTSPAQCLQTLASSYQPHVFERNVNTGHSIALNHFVWAARSFQAQADTDFDLYYVYQSLRYAGPVGPQFHVELPPWRVGPATFVDTPEIPDPGPRILTISPQTTRETRTQTSGVTESFGGSVGYNETQGVNATGSGGVTISNSTTTNVPPTIVDLTDATQMGEASWIKSIHELPPGTTQSIPLVNQWIWEIPVTAYSPTTPGCAESRGAVHAVQCRRHAPHIQLAAT
jgi:hypothetical protein